MTEPRVHVGCAVHHTDGEGNTIPCPDLYPTPTASPAETTVTDKPRASVVEIIASGRKPTEDGGGSVIVPNEVRLNGVSVFTTGNGVKVNEFTLGDDMVSVTLTLVVRKLTIAAASDVQTSGKSRMQIAQAAIAATGGKPYSYLGNPAEAANDAPTVPPQPVQGDSQTAELITAHEQTRQALCDAFLLSLDSTWARIVDTAKERQRSLAGLLRERDVPAPSLVALVRKTLGIDNVGPAGIPYDEALHIACRQLEKSEASQAHLRRERDALKAAAAQPAEPISVNVKMSPLSKRDVADALRQELDRAARLGQRGVR